MQLCVLPHLDVVFSEINHVKSFAGGGAVSFFVGTKLVEVMEFQWSYSKS